MKGVFEEIVESAIVYRIGIATAILAFIFCIGSIGFHFLEGMTFFEGFYMTFITISTIGFSELKSLSPYGRIFTMLIFVMGIGVISYIASQTTQVLFESELFLKRAMQKQLKKIEDHYIVCGYGRIGHRIAQVLVEADLPVVIVENRSTSIDRIKSDKLLFVEGNAQDEQVLLDAGIESAKALICTLASDQDNVFTTLIARELNPDMFILVRTNEVKNKKKMFRAGANKVISPYEIGADRMANVILRPNVDQFLEKMTHGASDDHAFDEVKVFEGAEIGDKTLADIQVRSKYEIVIIAIISKNNGNIQFNPGSNDRIQVGDSLIVLGDVTRIELFREEACNDARTLAERTE